MPNLPHASPIANFMTVHLPPGYWPLSTSQSIQAEIFAALEDHSEVEETGLAFMKRESGKTDSECEQLFRMFQAFIRQAKTFCTSSEALHHPASPLLAYYAFMNLAKAYLCRAAPDLMLRNGSLYHGLVSVPPNPSFQKEIVDTHEGVF